MENEAQILMTQAAKKRSFAMKNRGFQKQESSLEREQRIANMKKRMSCAACRAHGKVVFGR